MDGTRQSRLLAPVLMAVLLALVVPGVMYADLPPRSPPPRDKGGDKDDPPLVAFIELYVEPVQSGLWAVVQWQDTAGNWHDVEGWRDALVGGYQQWALFPPEYGRGPFRWAIYEGAGGKLLAASAPFDLPSMNMTRVTVSVAM